MSKTRKGFTLIELLVVIAIIAILAAILFPVFATAKENGRKASCLNNLTQLSRAFRMYLDDSHGRFPSGAPLYQVVDNKKNVYAGWVWFDGTWNGTYITPGITCNPRKGVIWPYVRNIKVYTCPSDIWERRRNYNLSYSMNYWLHYASEPSVMKPSRTVLLVDEGAGGYNKTLGYVVPIVDGWFVPDTKTPTDIHVGGCNFAYADGHAAWLQRSKYLSLVYRLDGVPGL